MSLNIHDSTTGIAQLVNGICVITGDLINSSVLIYYNVYEAIGTQGFLSITNRMNGTFTFISTSNTDNSTILFQLWG
jgi:hypothetical protein